MKKVKAKLALNKKTVTILSSLKDLKGGGVTVTSGKENCMGTFANSCYGSCAQTCGCPKGEVELPDDNYTFPIFSCRFPCTV